MNTDLFLLIGRKKLKLLYCQNKKDIREYEHENSAHIPFYFYSENTEVLLGNSAKLKYDGKNAYAYCNYFDLIRNVNDEFIFFGNKQKIGKLIVRATEFLINEFLKNVLFSDETVFDLKESINLNLVYYNDVTENEINYVNQVFNKEGYVGIKSFYYNYLLLNFLDKKRKIGSFKGYIIVDSIDTNLHINYFDNLNSKQYKDNVIGKGLAVDPKIQLLGSTIINMAIKKARSLVNPDEELQKHDETFKEANDLFNKKAEFTIKITLSDNSSATVKIKKSNIKEKLIFANEFTKDFSFLDHFFDKCGVQQSDLIFILHKNMHSSGFIDKIKSNYPNVYHSNELSSEIFELFYIDDTCIQRGNHNLNDDKKPLISEQKTSDFKSVISNKSTAVKTSTANSQEVKPIPKKPVLPKNTKKTNATNRVPPPPPPPPPPRPLKEPKSYKPLKVKSNVTGKVKTEDKTPLPPPLPKKNTSKKPAIVSPPPLPINNEVKKNKPGRRAPLAPPPIPKKKN